MVGSKKIENYLYSGEDFRHDLLELYPSMYLTWLSMIQGVVLAVIVYNLSKLFNSNKLLSIPTASFIIYLFLSLGVLSLIWYDYLYNNVFRRLPNLRDAIFPVMFGLLQAGLAFNLNNPKVWLGFALGIGFVACFAYRNTRIQIKKEMEFCQKHRVKYINCATIKYLKYYEGLKYVIQMIQLEKVRFVWFMMIVVGISIVPRLKQKDPTKFASFLILDLFLLVFLGYLLLLSFIVTRRLFQSSIEIKPDGNIEMAWAELTISFFKKKIRIDFLGLEKIWIQRMADKALSKIEPDIHREISRKNSITIGPNKSQSNPGR